jgi:hypothetical protein
MLSRFGTQGQTQITMLVLLGVFVGCFRRVLRLIVHLLEQLPAQVRFHLLRNQAGLRQSPQLSGNKVTRESGTRIFMGAHGESRQSFREYNDFVVQDLWSF